MRILTIGVTALALAAALKPGTASAQVISSYCNVERHGHDKLMSLQRLYGENDEVPDSYYDVVGDEEKSCGAKVDAKTAKSEVFFRFVFAEVTLYSQREYLVSRSFPMDELDRNLNLSCTAELIPTDRDISDEGADMIGAAFTRSKVNLADLNDYEKSALFTYIIASADHWRRGQQIGLLPACKKA